MKALRSLRLRAALLAFEPPPDRRPKGCCTKRSPSGHIPGAGASYPPGGYRGGPMCKTLKTDIKLFAAAIAAAAIVLCADVSLADIVNTLSGAN
ncbi:hypothetical protein [Mesorhizobium sp. P5_C1]